MIPVIKKYIETNRLLTPKKPVIVGFSGGSDSVALLFIFKQLGYRCIAAHCNFHLRADESDRDEAFCKSFAEQHDLLFEKIDFDTVSYATGQHISHEMAARELRYEWFESLRQKHNAQAIAVAHHRNDSNETILLNMIRGTGIRGLCGISPRNGWVVRPLLCVGKDDIRHFIAKHQLPYLTDSTNLSDAYTRNFIRLRLLPLMQKINPSVDEALMRMAVHIADVENIYLQTIEDIRNDLLKKNEDEVFSISIRDLLRQPSPHTILYELIIPFGFTRILSESIYNSIISGGVSGKIFNAPDSGYQLLKDRTSLFIYKKPQQSSKIYQISNIDVDIQNLPVQLSIKKVNVNAAFEIEKSPLTATFDFDKLQFPLLLRQWRKGDWFIPFGMKGRKKISDYFSDHKFNCLQKKKVWLLCSGEDILWIVGERADNRFRVDNQTKDALIVNFFNK